MNSNFRLRIVIVAAVTAFGLLAIGMIVVGPRNLWGMFWYDQRREGHLRAGDMAPDVELTALDGVTKVRLMSQLQGRPLVLIFGSYT